MVDNYDKYIAVHENNIIVYVPTINDGKKDFELIIKLNFLIKQSVSLILKQTAGNKKIKITFNFSKCDFLRQNAIAYLGAVSFLLKSNGVDVRYNLKSMSKRVITMLREDGFINHNFKKYIDFETEVSDKSIEFNNFQGDLSKNPRVSKDISDYVNNEWLEKTDITFSKSLKSDMSARLFELFANALEHSNSLIGCVACGQTYDETEEVVLSIVDMGVGISKKVKKYVYDTEKIKINSFEAMERAFTTGFTTRSPQSGGMGLSLLVEFLKLNGGEIDIYCNDINWSTDGRKIDKAYVPYEFEGTMINVRFKIDSKSIYKYKGEVL